MGRSVIWEVPLFLYETLDSVLFSLQAHAHITIHDCISLIKDMEKRPDYKQLQVCSVCVVDQLASTLAIASSWPINGSFTGVLNFALIFKGE